MATRNLGIVDYAVSRAITELRTDHQFINAKQIADKINGQESAVYRSLKRLKAANLVEVDGGSSRNGGYAYRYVGE